MTCNIPALNVGSYPYYTPSKLGVKDRAVDDSQAVTTLPYAAL